MKRISYLVAALPILILSSSCEDKALQKRVDELEAELRSVRADTKDTVQSAMTRTDTIIQRVETAEKSSSDAIEQTSTLLGSVGPRFERLEEMVNENRRLLDKKEQHAHLIPGIPGAVPLSTEVGSLIIQLDKIIANPNGSGFLAKTNIGNPFSLQIDAFDLKGDYGALIPSAVPGQDMSVYREKLDAWQKGMRPYDISVQKTLRPNSWTEVNIPLITDNKEAVKFIRVSLAARSVKLIQQDQLDKKVTELQVGSPAGNIFHTSYGGFLVSVNRVESQGASSKVFIRVGNPFGLTVNEFKLRGEYGPSKPTPTPGENPELYGRRLQAWLNSLKPFDATVSANIGPFRWSNASFVIPSGDTAQILTIRCAMAPTSVALPNPVQ